MDVTVEVPPGEPDKYSIESFEDMNLDAKVMFYIKFHELDKPTPIQAQAIPIICPPRRPRLRRDGLRQAAAFHPMIQHCLQQPEIRRGDGPFAIVMAPTRSSRSRLRRRRRSSAAAARGSRPPSWWAART